MSRTLQAVLLLLAVLALAGLAPTGPVGADEIQPASLTPQAVWVAMPTLADLTPVLPPPHDWSPGLPEFQIAPVACPVAPGERCAVTQRFSQPAGREAPGYLQVSVIVFDSGDRAHAAFRDWTTWNGVRIGISDPYLGNERRYVVNPLPDGRYEMRAYCRVGFFLATVSVVSPGMPVSTASVGAITAKLIDRLQDLRWGRLTTPPLPADFDQLMPPSRVEFEVGPAGLSTVMPPQNWPLRGLGASQGMPGAGAGQVTKVYYRLYQDSLLPGHMVQATLLSFKDAEAASALVKSFKSSSDYASTSLPRGQTGPLSAMRFSPAGQYYELMFAKGAYVGDVIESAPSLGYVDMLAQIAVRKTAESWYASLPAPVSLGNTP